MVPPVTADVSVDAEIVEQALVALGQLRAAHAYAHIVPFLTHDDRWVH
jgi:hypothetical protein